MEPTGRTARRIPAVPIVAAAAAVAIWGIAVLHVAGALVDPAGPVPVVDPLRLTVSDYVTLPGGYLVLGIAAGALAVAGAVLAVAAGRAGASRTVVVLLGSWAVAMAVAGIFPTNPPGTPAGVVAAVHRYAGAWVFAVLPVAVLLLARGPAVVAAVRRRLVLLASLGGVAAAAFLLSHVAMDASGSPTFPLLGGVERVLYGVVILVLVATARALAPAPLPTPVAVSARALTGSTS